MTITIWHNPDCGTSRKVLAALEAAGHRPLVRLYLKDGPDEAEIRAVLAAMKARPRDILRQRGGLYTELGLENAELDDDSLIRILSQFPALIERPIVISAKGAVLCRPMERYLTVL